MLSLLYLGSVIVAFMVSLLSILILGAIGWGLSRWVGSVAATAMSIVMVMAAGVIVAAMNYVIRDTTGEFRQVVKSVAWAMTPALGLAALFAWLFWRAGHPITNHPSPKVL